MASVDELTRAHYLDQNRSVRRAAAAAQSAWRRVSGTDLDTSWRTLAAPALVDAVTSGQQSTAAPADAYVGAVVVSDGLTSQPAGQVQTRSLVGTAADGRPLLSLLYQPVIETRWRMLAGQSVEEALLGSLSTLLRMVESEVADAGRAADGISIASNRTCTGYVRQLSPPSCSRCVVLAGKVYAFNQGFQRHPHCDCVHVPTTRYRHQPTMDPEAYFGSLSRAEQDRIFTAAGAQAIRDGADLASGVNARRAM